MSIKKPTETALVNACLLFLRIKGYHCWRQNTGATKMGDRFIRFSEPGISDILGVSPTGQFIAVECKMPGRGPTPEQRQFLEAVKKRGGMAGVVKSIDDLRRLIGDLDGTEERGGAA